MSEELILSVLLAATVLACAVAAAAIARARRRREEMRARLVAALVERLGDLPEFVSFASSAEGRALIGVGDASAAIAARLLWSLLLASAMLGLGLVMLWLGQPAPLGADLNLVRAAEDYHWWGMVLTPVAAALLVAVGLAATLSRRWGVLGRDV
jgi:hypothetical protein